MDELLSLFNSDSPAPTAAATKELSAPASRVEHFPETGSLRATPDDVSDDFGSSFGDAFAGRDSKSSATTRHVTPSPKTEKQSITATVTLRSQNDTPYDPITNLRITDRYTSRADMIDAFSPFQYKSCSMLAAFSKKEWATHVVKPSSSAAGRTMAGKTDLVTCGIVTNEVGSKLSQKTGRAFAMINLGDLPANSKLSAFGAASGTIHSSVTIFLFGDALRVLNANTKHYLNGGYAVAVLGPIVMPPKKDDKSTSGTTSVSLSVSDPRQILLIGKCIDCDRCKGTTRKRTMSDFGNPKFEDVRCGALIDLRMGAYCSTHKRQGLSSSGQGSNHGNGAKKNNTANNLTFMQKQRLVSSFNSKKEGLQVGKRNDLVTSSVNSEIRGTASSRLSEALSQAGLSYNPYSNAQSAFFNEPTTNSHPQQQILKRAPLHMKKSTLSNTTHNMLAGLNNDAEQRVNPYKPTKTKQATTIKTKTAEDILGAALKRKRQKTEGLSSLTKSKQLVQTANKRPMKVFHTEGYDGSVPVPKPSSTLFKNASSVHCANNAPTQSAPRGLPANEAQCIIDRQKNLADLLKEQKGNTPALACARGANLSSKLRINNLKVREDDPFATFFGNDPFSTQSLNRDAILNAKSRFASAATAEEYTRARSVVQQLEVQESEIDKRKERAEKNNTGSSASAPASIVTTGWVCKTCKTKSLMEPLRCVRAGHDVRQQRELKEKKSAVGSRNYRMERHGKEDTDGGLTLGSGLEWSGWRGYLS
ncbi:hypothetical protein HJC23_006437 [Cyclotella cryptica]|uniref:Uncharacterized protein n=1 Tax=Cyclotella cryptica TaxID=29204 RepID=A0ABD3QW67_9STRA|eukprot:CCRYP_001848-RA/>CCRYP_001848-RA protein AED:0.00 eAED:0.00 QI:135/1/1/1/0/0/2/1684/758